MFRLHNAACTFLHIGRLGRVRLAADRRGARRGRLELEVDCQLLRCRDSALAAALDHASFSGSAMVTKSFSKIPELTHSSAGRWRSSCRAWAASSIHVESRRCSDDLAQKGIRPSGIKPPTFDTLLFIHVQCSRPCAYRPSCGKPARTGMAGSTEQLLPNRAGHSAFDASSVM